MTEAKKNPTKLVTPDVVRLCYLHVLEPKENDKGEKKYQCSILVPKTAKATLDAYKKCVEAVKVDPYSAKKWQVAEGKVPQGLKMPLRDGDAEKADDHPEYAGHFFFNATSDLQPGIVDLKLQKILDPTEIYSGMYARVAVNFYAFNNSGNKGVAASLLNIQKVRDGEPLAGTRSKAEDDFADFSDAPPPGDDDYLG